MDFQQIDLPQHTQPSLLHSRISSVSTTASVTGIDDLIDNVLDDMEEYAIDFDHEEKEHQPAAHNQMSQSPQLTAKHVHAASSSIDDNSIDPTPSLPLSTTGLAKDNQYAAMSANVSSSSSNHNNDHKPSSHAQLAYQQQDQPQAQAVQFKLFSPNPFYPGQSLPDLVQVAPMQRSQTQPSSHYQSVPPSRPTLQNTGSMHSVRSTHSVQSGVIPQAMSPRSHRTMSPRSYHSTQTSGLPSLASLTSLQSDIIKKLKKILRDKDEDGDGRLDLEEFSEAIHEVDRDINNQDLEDVFDSLCNKKRHEISISRFIKFITKAQVENPQSFSSLTSPTPKAIFRGAFPDIFSDPEDDTGHREIWGDAHSTSIHKLEEQLQEEAENEGVIDFPEFEAAINNMGIEFTKSQLKKLFAHFLGEQDVYDRKMKIIKTRKKGDRHYEVRLGFLMELLKKTVDNHSHLKPKQILQLAFMELLMNENKLNKRSSFLKRKRSSKRMQQMLMEQRSHDADSEDTDDEADHKQKRHDEEEEEEEEELETVKEGKEQSDNDQEKEDSFQENPDFDNEFGSNAASPEMGGDVSASIGSPPPLSSRGGGSYEKGDRNLMRMGSTAYWNDNDVQQQAQEMQNQLMMLEQQNSGINISKNDMAMIGGNANMYTSVPQKRTFGYYK